MLHAPLPALEGIGSASTPRDTAGQAGSLSLCCDVWRHSHITATDWGKQTQAVGRSWGNA